MRCRSSSKSFPRPAVASARRSGTALKAIIDELGTEHVSWREINVLDELDYAVELGVLSPPAIAIDGELVFPALPSPDRLRTELMKRLGMRR